MSLDPIAVAALVTAIATLVYVGYSVRMLGELRRQTMRLEQTASFDAVKRVMDDLERIRDARHLVYQLASEDPDKWTADEKKAAETVMRAFDLYGLLDRNHFVSRSLLYHFYRYPAETCWDKLKTYIQRERSKRNQPGHMWEFQQLAGRAKAGPRHPAETGAADWPALVSD